MRSYAPVIVRGEEDKGVRLWSFGKTVYQSLLNIMLDEDYGDITDPTSGRDVKVNCTKAPGRQWAMTEVRPRGKSTMLSSDKDTTKQWLSNLPDLDELYTCKTYEELEKIVNDWLGGDDTSSEGTTRGNFENKKTSESSQSTSTDDSSDGGKYKSLDEAFADLEDV